MNYIIDNPGILLLSGIIAMIFVFIRDRWVSNQAVGNDKMKIIAEIGWNFMGDMDLASDMVKDASDAKATPVKFQYWNPEKLKSGPLEKIFSEAFLQ